MLFSQIFYITIKIGQVNILEQLSNLEKLQTEYMAVLGCLDEGIITRGPLGLKYFNNKGRQLLEHAKVEGDASEHEIIKSEISFIQENIQKKKYKWNCNENSKKA